jgi:hypothetical protein
MEKDAGASESSSTMSSAPRRVGAFILRRRFSRMTAMGS